MDTVDQVQLLNRGFEVWNAWRDGHAETEINLAEANLIDAFLMRSNLSRASLQRANCSGAYLASANLSRANLAGANLSMADLSRADLSEANLSDAYLSGAYLSRANLSGACLERAFLARADLSGANLSGAQLRGADLSGASLVQARLDDADFTDCRVYGVSAWDVRLTRTRQSRLVITPDEESAITVDDLELAQFIYLLLNNQKIRRVIDTITSKVVLLLGSFTPERKVLLDALRDTLKLKNYSPVVFDFEAPAGRDLTETLRTLAHLSRFVIADITDAKSVPQELMAVVPDLPSVPVQPLLVSSQREYGMFEHFRRYPWVLPEILYDTPEELVRNLDVLVIGPAEAKAEQQKRQR